LTSFWQELVAIDWRIAQTSAPALRIELAMSAVASAAG
jgi:hypothetical protein